MTTMDQVYERVLIPMTQVFRQDRKMSDTEQQHALAEYADALMGFSVEQLGAGWRAVRDDYRGKSWPPIAQLVDACRSARIERPGANAQTINARMTDRGIQPWGGGCKCSRCADKTRSPGFYQAEPDTRERKKAAPTSAPGPEQFR
jgi:hypothetical protein